MLLDFNERTRTNISKKISRCAHLHGLILYRILNLVSTDEMDYYFLKQLNVISPKSLSLLPYYLQYYQLVDHLTY